MDLRGISDCPWSIVKTSSWIHIDSPLSVERLKLAFNHFLPEDILVIGITSWMTVARLVRGAVLKLREMDFIRATRSYGASDLHIMVKHMIPNVLGPILVASTMGTAWAILTESGLSFLGYGIQEPVASWGNMLQSAQATIGVYPEPFLRLAQTSLLR